MQNYLKINSSPRRVGAELLQFEQWPEWWPGVDRVEVVERGEGMAILDLVIALRKTINMTLEVDFSRPESIRFVQRKGWFKSYQGCWDLLSLRDGSGGTILKITTNLTPPALVPKSRIYQDLASSLDTLGQRLDERLRESGLLESEPDDEPSAADEIEEVGTKVYLFPTRDGIEVWIRGRCFNLKYGGWSNQGVDWSSLTGSDSA